MLNEVKHLAASQETLRFAQGDKVVLAQSVPHPKGAL